MSGDESARARGPFEIGAEIEGRYGVLRAVGSGSVGVVYEAEHLFTGGRVAIKALYNRAGDHHQRMRLEARALAEMRHPNVVPVTDGGVTPDGVVWFAMPLLEGKTLREEVWRKRCLGVERALRIGIQIAHGLAEAHARGLIHRDLKPENVFLVSEDDSVRVLDFGTSKFQRGELKTTDRFRIIGTYAYMSPERLQADLVDHRADIYALGHILYEMLSGMHALSDGPGPLDLPPTYELGLRQIYAPPPPLSERAPQTPDYVAHIVYRALAKDRRHRHESMAVLANELEQALARWRAESKANQREPSAGVRAGPTPLVQTEKLSPGELAMLSAATAPSALRHCSEPNAPLQHSQPSAGAQMRAIATDLVLGAAQFTCPAGNDSEVLHSLTALCDEAQADPARIDSLHTALVIAARADEGVRRRLRLLLATLPDAAALDTALLALAAREPAASTAEQRLILLAQGAAVCIEPDARLDAAENALFALERASEDVRPFALGVLIAFSRATPHQQATARGALLALLLGGPEDTELARAELARLMMDVADRVPAEPVLLGRPLLPAEPVLLGRPLLPAEPVLLGRPLLPAEPVPANTLPAAAAPGLVSLGRASAEPRASAAPAEPTPATPSAMSTPSTPPLHQVTPRPRPNLWVALGIAAVCSGTIALISLLTRATRTTTPDASAASARSTGATAATAISTAASAAPASPTPASTSTPATAASPALPPALPPAPVPAPPARGSVRAGVRDVAPAKVGKPQQPPGIPVLDGPPGELAPAKPINDDPPGELAPAKPINDDPPARQPNKPKAQLPSSGL